jgi:phosphate transport system protein
LERDLAEYVKGLEESLRKREITPIIYEMDLKEMDNRIITFLALYQPQGWLLREIVAYLKIIPFLYKIRKSIKGFLKKGGEVNNPVLDQLYQLSLTALNSLKMGVIAGDIEEVLPSILESEKRADQLYKELVKEVKSMEELEEGLKLLNLAKKLERITDSVKTIAYYLLFAQEGYSL